MKSNCRNSINERRSYINKPNRFMVVSPLFIFAMIAISFIAIILLKT